MCPFPPDYSPIAGSSDLATVALQPRSTQTMTLDLRLVYRGGISRPPCHYLWIERDGPAIEESGSTFDLPAYFHCVLVLPRHCNSALSRIPKSLRNSLLCPARSVSPLLTNFLQPCHVGSECAEKENDCSSRSEHGQGQAN